MRRIRQQRGKLLRRNMGIDSKTDMLLFPQGLLGNGKFSQPREKMAQQRRRL